MPRSSGFAKECIEVDRELFMSLFEKQGEISWEEAMYMGLTGETKPEKALRAFTKYTQHSLDLYHHVIADILSSADMRKAQKKWFRRFTELLKARAFNSAKPIHDAFHFTPVDRILDKDIKEKLEKYLLDNNYLNPKNKKNMLLGGLHSDLAAVMEANPETLPTLSTYISQVSMAKSASVAGSFASLAEYQNYLRDIIGKMLTGYSLITLSLDPKEKINIRYLEELSKKKSANPILIKQGSKIFIYGFAGFAETKVEGTLEKIWSVTELDPKPFSGLPFSPLRECALFSMSPFSSLVIEGSKDGKKELKLFHVNKDSTLIEVKINELPIKNEGYIFIHKKVKDEKYEVEKNELKLFYVNKENAELTEVVISELKLKDIIETFNPTTEVKSLSENEFQQLVIKINADNLNGHIPTGLVSIINRHSLTQSELLTDKMIEEIKTKKGHNFFSLQDMKNANAKKPRSTETLEGVNEGENYAKLVARLRELCEKNKKKKAAVTSHDGFDSKYAKITKITGIHQKIEEAAADISKLINPPKYSNQSEDDMSACAGILNQSVNKPIINLCASDSAQSTGSSSSHGSLTLSLHKVTSTGSASSLTRTDSTSSLGTISSRTSSRVGTPHSGRSSSRAGTPHSGRSSSRLGTPHSAHRVNDNAELAAVSKMYNNDIEAEEQAKKSDSDLIRVTFSDSQQNLHFSDDSSLVSSSSSLSPVSPGKKARQSESREADNLDNIFVETLSLPTREADKLDISIETLKQPGIDDSGTPTKQEQIIIQNVRGSISIDEADAVSVRKKEEEVSKVRIRSIPPRDADKIAYAMSHYENILPLEPLSQSLEPTLTSDKRVSLVTNDSSKTESDEELSLMEMLAELDKNAEEPTPNTAVKRTDSRRRSIDWRAMRLFNKQESTKGESTITMEPEKNILAAVDKKPGTLRLKGELQVTQYMSPLLFGKTNPLYKKNVKIPPAEMTAHSKKVRSILDKMNNPIRLTDEEKTKLNEKATTSTRTISHKRASQKPG